MIITPLQHEAGKLKRSFKTFALESTGWPAAHGKVSGEESANLRNTGWWTIFIEPGRNLLPLGGKCHWMKDNMSREEKVYTTRVDLLMLLLKRKPISALNHRSARHRVNILQCGEKCRKCVKNRGCFRPLKILTHPLTYKCFSFTTWSHFSVNVEFPLKK